MHALVSNYKPIHCYWMTATLYRKYNTFSGRESEQQHRKVRHNMLLLFVKIYERNLKKLSITLL